MAKLTKFKKFLKQVKDEHPSLDEPIHFRMDQSPYKFTKDGHVIVTEPIHFRMGQAPSKKLSESKLTDLNNENKKKHSDDDTLSLKLHKATASTLEKEDKRHIFNYTRFDDDKQQNGSRSLNTSLVGGEKLEPHDQHIHDSIMKHAKPSGHEVHMFSGTKRNFEEMSRHTKDKVFHLPAHTSVTHHLGTARDFADQKGGSVKHLIHIHVKPHDKILHVSEHSAVHEEHETIIPAGTKLKYHETSEHNSVHGDTYMVHHMSIHSQN